MGAKRGIGRAPRRLGYGPRTVRSRWGARPGPAPTEDRRWAAVLEGWVDRQAGRLVADVIDDVDGRPVPAPDIVGRARRLWTLAHLRRRGHSLDGLERSLVLAQQAVDRHRDGEHGGYSWSVERPRNDAKLLYGQCAVVHALSELAVAEPTVAPDVITEAEGVLALAASRVAEGGSVNEFLDRRWEPLAAGCATEVGIAGTVTIGGQLHLVEAAAGLVEASGSDLARDVGRATAAILRDRFLSGPGRPDCSTTDERGHRRAGPVSLGHKVEAAWILADAAAPLGLDHERSRARRWVEETLAAGFDHGGLNDSVDPGFRPGGEQRSWWVQAELLRALVEIDEGPASPGRAVMHDLLRWLHRHQVDPRTGQARQLMTHRGLVLVTGDGTTARTGYHDVRAYTAATDLLVRP